MVTEMSRVGYVPRRLTLSMAGITVEIIDHVVFNLLQREDVGEHFYGVHFLKHCYFTTSGLRRLLLSLLLKSYPTHYPKYVYSIFYMPI